MMRWMWSLCIITICSCVMQADEVASQIVRLREQQRYADYPTYISCHDTVAQLHATHGGSNKQWFGDWAAYLRTLAWVIWQIAALLAAACAGWCIAHASRGNCFTAVFVTLIALALGYIAWVGYEAISHTSGVISRDHVPVYVAPDTTYPVRENLARYDEVDVVHRVDDWVKVRYTHTYGWISRNDIVLQSQ